MSRSWISFDHVVSGHSHVLANPIVETLAPSALEDGLVGGVVYPERFSEFLVRFERPVTIACNLLINGQPNHTAE